MRTVIAFLTAGVIPIVVACVLAVIYTFEIGGFPDVLPVVAIDAAILALVVTLPCLVLLGLPVSMILKKYNYLSWNSYVAVGAAISFFFLAFATANRFTMLNQFDLFYRMAPREFMLITIGSALSGPLSALAFWAVDRPDRSSKSRQK